jgi:hypothetical protein
VTISLATLRGPGPLWPSAKLTVVLGNTELSFAVHAIRVDDNVALLLYRGAEEDDKSIALVAFACFARNGWQGFHFDNGVPPRENPGFHAS